MSSFTFLYHTFEAWGIQPNFLIISGAEFEHVTSYTTAFQGLLSNKAEAITGTSESHESLQSQHSFLLLLLILVHNLKVDSYLKDAQ